MVNSVAIPQEIIDSVIEAVGDDKHLLKECALVSSSFLLPTRKRLFSEITLNDEQAFQRLHEVFVQNPGMLSFVRSIAIVSPSQSPPDGADVEFMDSTSLLAILRLPFHRLESFSLSMELWGLYRFSGELRAALSNIIHSSTLKTLCITNVSSRVLSPWLLGVHLRKLTLESVWLDDFDSENSASLTLTASEDHVASDTVIDQCVWYFVEDMGMALEPISLPFMCRLRSLEIRHVNLCSENLTSFHRLTFALRLLCVSLTLPATLEHLKLAISFYDDYDLYVKPEVLCAALRDPSLWTHMDSIITHPVGSQLQRVEIDIDYSFLYPSESDSDNVLAAILDSLPSLRERGILFVAATARE